MSLEIPGRVAVHLIRSVTRFEMHCYGHAVTENKVFLLPSPSLESYGATCPGAIAFLFFFGILWEDSMERIHFHRQEHGKDSSS